MAMASSSMENSSGSPEIKKRKVSHPPPTIEPDDLQMIGKLGEGAFGTVYRKQWTSKNQEVAVKRFHAGRDDQKGYENELGVLWGLSHPNIVKLLGIEARSSEDKAFTLVLEICNGGSLKTYLRKSKEKLPPDQFTSWATQAARAIEYLHDENIIHQDIKSDNYLIADNNVLKLSDFGLSKFAEKTMDNEKDVGTAAYMPPEIHKSGKLSPTFDFFSYGMVLWELLTRGIPFGELKTCYEIIYQITQKNTRPTIPRDCPEDLEKLMKQCWEEDRMKRPTIEQILSVVSKQRDTLVDSHRVKEEPVEPKEDLQLRRFQLELAGPALPGPDGGKNTIIVAPTGCGKTVVAVKVAKDFLETAGVDASSSAVSEKPKKVIFLVDKVLLVDQQCNVFRRFLDSRSVIGLSGENSQGSLSHILTEKSIVVMTAQVLVNAIEDKDVKLSDIGLLIMDECHNCQGKSPYNNIMAMVREMKLSGEQPRPQVLGLTASLSFGQAGSVSLAEENTLLLCANLDARVISTVQSPECLKELAMYQNIPDEEIVEAPGRTQDPFADEIKIIMEEIEGMIQNTPDWSGLVKNNPKLRIPNSRGINAYIQWLRETENDVAIIVTDMKVKRKLLTCVNHLEMYNQSLGINHNIRSKDALTYLEKFRNDLELKRHGFDDTDSYLVRLFDEKKSRLQQISNDPANHNPVLMKLGTVLKKAFSPLSGTDTADSDTKRGILFAKTRAYAVALKRWIDETDELKFLKPGSLTGTGRTDVSDNQMTQRQQIDLLSRFREGNHKLIVATSIAQEGLDVASCNVVVRYNHTTNIVGRIQTRGRNRAKGGVYYLVVNEDLKLGDADMKIRIEEKVMMKATKRKQEQLNENRPQTLEKILQLQKKDHENRESARKKAESHQKRRVQERVKLSCVKCDQFACCSDDLRCIKKQHHVVVDESFTSRFETKPMAKPIAFDNMTINKQLVCKRCQRDWGTLGTYEGKELPFLHPRGLILEDTAGKRRILKKWSQAWFQIEDYDLFEN